MQNKPAEALRLNNLGVAYMNQQRMEGALELFEQAHALDPTLFAARLNQGVALLNLQRIEPARAVLLATTQQQPKNPRAWYNLGLLHKNAGEAEKALEAFQRAAELAPQDADTHYFVGLLLTQLQKYVEAIAAFQRSLALNPFHVSAEFGLSRAHQRAGDSAKAREHLARFQKLTQEKLGAPMSLAYGDQGNLSLAEPALTKAQASRSIPIRFAPVPAVRWGIRVDMLNANKIAERKAAKLPPAPLDAWSACLVDYDRDGREDIFLNVSEDGRGGRLFRNSPTSFQDVTVRAGLGQMAVGRHCAAGDFDNDDWTDLAVDEIFAVVLYRNQGKGTFRRIPNQSCLELNRSISSLVFVDYDHDGDLDLYITSPQETPAAGNVLCRNNGDRTFTDVTEQTGLRGGESSGQALAADLNNDRAIDFLVETGEDVPLVYLNRREGPFDKTRPIPNSEDVSNAHLSSVLDFDRDGWMDIALGHSERGLTLWRNLSGRGFERMPLPAGATLMTSAIATLDYDNDGWVDLIATGLDRSALKPGEELTPQNAARVKHVVRLFRNAGPSGFEDATERVGLSEFKPDYFVPADFIVSDFDLDGDVDVALIQLGARANPVVFLRNDGGNKNNRLRLSLKGLADNKSAIGTKVEVFAGAIYQKFEVTSPNDLIVGLGQEKQADVVRLLWPTGVPQDEVELAANKRHVVTEIDRRGSSCPTLFAWNGIRYEFIADAIGPGVVGHWVAPGLRNISDPTEYIKVPGSSVRTKNGQMSFRFVEPMEELVYLDQLRLLAVDHPAGVDVYPNERFYASGPPFPEFKIIASRDAQFPRVARDDSGRDVLPLLMARDRKYVSGFADAPFKGFAETHWLELELPRPYQSGPLRLLMHGFTDYFTATSVYAAQQAGVTAVVPYVEALSFSGQWVRVVDDMGFPAGLARTMVTDLTGHLPAGTRRIRIVTNLKVYWDQILIDTTPDGESVRVSEAPLAGAQLSFRGYPLEVRGAPAADIHYIYEEVSRTGPYAHAAGNYTRYGDVRPLLKDAEDHFVIFGSGEEVAVEFTAAALPPVPAGWIRDFFFYVDGFAKDMDFYAAFGDTVEPLPHHRMGRYPTGDSNGYPAKEADLNYQLDFNTRHVSGRPAASLRFTFPPIKNKRQ